jgi:hypothetical protein
MLHYGLRLISTVVFLIGACVLDSGAIHWQVELRLDAQTAVPEACSLLSVEELEKTLGRQFGRSRQRQEQSGTSCRFTAGAGGSITLSVAASSKADFDHFRKLLADQGNKPAVVSGVGDDAYYWDSRIYVLVGSRTMTIWNGEPQQPAEKLRGEVLALAKALAPKLR